MATKNTTTHEAKNLFAQNYVSLRLNWKRTDDYEMMDSDEQLIQLAAKGHIESGSILIQRYGGRVYGYLFRQCGNQTDAEDLTQITFQKAWQSLSRFEGRSSFSSWIHGIAHHVYLDWARRRDRFDSREEQWWNAHPDSGICPFEQTADLDFAKQLFAFVEELDQTTRDAIHLRYYQGLTLQETALILDVPLRTLNHKIRKGLDTLRIKAARLDTTTIK